MQPEEMLLSLPGLSLEAAQDYHDYRAKTKKNPLKATTWKMIVKQILLSGWEPDDALAEAMNRNWEGVKAIWLKRVENEEMKQLAEIKNGHRQPPIDNSAAGRVRANIAREREAERQQKQHNGFMANDVIDVWPSLD